MLRKCFLIAFLVMFVAIQTALGGYYIHKTQISPSTSIGIGDSVTITVELVGSCCHNFLYCPDPSNILYCYFHCIYQAPIELYVNSIKVQESTISQALSHCEPSSKWNLFPCRGSFTYTPPAPGTYNIAVRTYCPLDGTSSWSDTYTVTVHPRVINLAVYETSQYFIPNDISCLFKDTESGTQYFCPVKDPLGYTASSIGTIPTPVPLSHASIVPVVAYRSSASTTHEYGLYSYIRSAHLEVRVLNSLIEYLDISYVRADQNVVFEVKTWFSFVFRENPEPPHFSYLTVRDEAGNVVFQNYQYGKGVFIVSLPAGQYYTFTATITYGRNPPATMEISGGSFRVSTYQPAAFDTPNTIDFSLYFPAKLHDGGHGARGPLGDPGIISARLEYCPAFGTTFYESGKKSYKTVYCCIPYPPDKKFPVYIQEPAVFGVDKPLTITPNGIEIYDPTNIYAVQKGYLEVVYGRFHNVAKGKKIYLIPNLAPYQAPSTSIEVAFNSTQLPLMQTNLPVAITAFTDGFVTLGSGSFGMPNGYMKYCNPSKIIVDNTVLEIPSRCNHYWGTKFKAYISSPVDNIPGATKIRMISIKALGIDDTVIASTDYQVQVNRGYAFMNDSIFTLVISFSSSEPIQTAMLKNNAIQIRGVIVDPYSRIVFPMRGPISNVDYTLVLCRQSGCEERLVRVLGSPPNDISVTYVCASGQPPAYGTPVVQILSPTHGARLNLGVVEVRADAYVQGGVGSITSVDMSVRRWNNYLQAWETIDWCTRTWPISGNTYACSFTLLEYTTYNVVVFAKASNGATAADSVTFTIGTVSGPTPLPPPLPPTQTPTPACPDNKPNIGFTSPADQARFAVGATIPIAVSYSDDKLVSRIELYVNGGYTFGTSVSQTSGTLTISPSPIPVVLSSQGSYTLRVVAIDSCNQSTERTITVYADPVTIEFNAVFDLKQTWPWEPTKIRISPSQSVCPWLAEIGELSGSSFTWYSSIQFIQTVPCSDPPLRPNPEFCGIFRCKYSPGDYSTAECKLIPNCYSSRLGNDEIPLPKEVSVNIIETLARNGALQ